MKVFLSYAASLVGLGLVAFALMGAYTSNLSYPAARLRLITMLRQNVNQAEMMCKAAKGTFYECIASAIKIAATVPTTDINIIRMTTAPGYDAAVTSVKMHWKKLMGHGKKGAVAVIGGLVIAIVAKTNPAFHIIAMVLVAGAAVWFLITKAENEGALIRAKAELLPELDRALAEGRYYRAG